MSLYDLILQGGRVIDPAQDVDGIFDVAIRNGHIATIDADLPSSAATKVIQVSGQLVLPGMIDTHAHVYQHVTGAFGLIN
jgi:dihydroorotase